jgi:hypothetical protein
MIISSSGFLGKCQAASSRRPCEEELRTRKIIWHLKLTSTEQIPSATSAEHALEVDSTFLLPFFSISNSMSAFTRASDRTLPMLQISLLALHVCAPRRFWASLERFGPLKKTGS